MTHDETVPIGEYAVLGDGRTAALVSRRGSVDWLCLPQFDSPACFAALVGEPTNGHWRIGPAGDHTSERRYLDDTAVLETTYTTETGVLRVTDLMPTGERRADVVRRVEGVSGTVEVHHSWLVRFDYGLGARVTESLRASVVSQAVKGRRPAKGRPPGAANTLKVRVDVPDLDL